MCVCVCVCVCVGGTDLPFLLAAVAGGCIQSSV